MTGIKKPLSSAALSALKPGSADLSDTGENRGLRFTCGSAGTKSFYYRYTSPVTKKLVQVHIGHYPEVGLAAAREQLQVLKSIRKEGRCPARERSQRRTTVSNMMTVKEVVDLYLTRYIEDRKVNGKLIEGARTKKGQSETRRTLYGDAVRVLGNISAQQVTRRMIVDLIMEVVDRGANVQAGYVLRELSAAFDYAIGLDHFPDDFANPALLAKSGLKRAKVKLTSEKGKRVFSNQELTLFLEWLPGSLFTPTQKNILRFTLWTGCRTGEITGAKWADVDLKVGTWHLKATKTGVERYVQLPNQAVKYLEQLRLVTGDYLFPSLKTGLPIQQKALTEQAWQMRKAKKMIDIDHWAPHDLRRTVRTGLSRLGCPSEVAEAILGHARGGIEGTYDLHTYEKECKIWLQKWADFMDELLTD